MSEAAAEMTGRFKAADLVDWFAVRYPKVRPKTVRAHIIGFTANDPSRKHMPFLSKRQPLFFKTSRGWLELLDPDARIRILRLRSGADRPGLPASLRDAAGRAGRLTRVRRLSAGFGAGYNHVDLVWRPDRISPPSSPDAVSSSEDAVSCRTSSRPKTMTSMKGTTTMARQISAHVLAGPLVQA
jgi:hypothetical protein